MHLHPRSPADTGLPEKLKNRINLICVFNGEREIKYILRKYESYI